MYVKIETPDYVNFILKELNNNGYEAYIVGGCVRDALMGIKPKDWDIAASALPEQIKKVFKKTYDTGIKHGTVTVRIGSECCEVTTYRIDGEYNDNRRPDEVIFTSDIAEDLRRRDFTMNAVAYNAANGFIDPYGGIKDIETGIIRAVNDPDERFKEDGLRMLRAVRFSAATDFNIEPETWEALKRNAPLIKHISAERVREELIKAIMSDHLHKLPLLWESGLMKLILPDYSARINFNKETLNSCEKSILLRISLFLRSLGRDALYVMKDLKFDNKTIKDASVLINRMDEKIHADGYELRKLMAEIGTEAFYNLIKLKKCIGENTIEAEAEAERIIQRGDCISLKDMKINGDDLKTLGIKDGKKIGETLRNLFDMVLSEPAINDYSILKARIPW